MSTFTSLQEHCSSNSEWAYLLEQFDTNRNMGITPADITYKSSRKIWWQCEKGHEWEASPYERSRGRGCPYCSGKRIKAGFNDLASQRPDLAQEWHNTKNSIVPTEVTVSSNRKVWWRCKNGHEWEAAIYSRTSGRNCPYCSGQRLLQGYNDLATTHPELAKQWDVEKNRPLSAVDVSAGSKKKIWWKCPQGHTWQAAVFSRVRGSGCPYCNGKLVDPDMNSFAHVHPDLALEWHPTKNGSLTPASVSSGSDRYVWWVCKCGHEYKSTVVRRAQGAGCPYCDGKRVAPGWNDLKTLDPEVASQWHPTLNGELTPDMVTKSSNKKVWWQCSLGHAWEAAINSRTGKSRPGCPYCSGYKALAGFNDLETLEPEIANQWHPTLNDGLTPDMVTRSSNKKVWWQCQFGHVWQAVIKSRTGAKRHGCPVCARRINRRRKKKYDRIMEEIMFEKKL